MSGVQIVICLKEEGFVISMLVFIFCMHVLMNRDFKWVMHGG